VKLKKKLKKKIKKRLAKQVGRLVKAYGPEIAANLMTALVAAAATRVATGGKKRKKDRVAEVPAGE
jgi:hypothetical protein